MRVERVIKCAQFTGLFDGRRKGVEIKQTKEKLLTLMGGGETGEMKKACTLPAAVQHSLRREDFIVKSRQKSVQFDGCSVFRTDIGVYIPPTHIYKGAGAGAESGKLIPRPFPKGSPAGAHRREIEKMISLSIYIYIYTRIHTSTHLHTIPGVYNVDPVYIYI